MYMETWNFAANQLSFGSNIIIQIKTGVSMNRFLSEVSIYFLHSLDEILGQLSASNLRKLPEINV